MFKRSGKSEGLLETRYRCDCHTHEIEVSQWEEDEYDDDDVYITLWYSGRNWRRAPDKLKTLWRILRGMTIHQEEIILKPDEAHELGRALLTVRGGKAAFNTTFTGSTKTTVTLPVRLKGDGDD